MLINEDADMRRFRVSVRDPMSEAAQSKPMTIEDANGAFDQLIEWFPDSEVKMTEAVPVRSTRIENRRFHQPPVSSRGRRQE